MIRFDEILGQQAAIELLDRMLETGRMPHALLFHGPEGVGKGTVARSFAATILCESGERHPCGECNGCRLVEHGGHPDLLIVERLPRKPPPVSKAAAPPATGDLKSQIVVDQIRQLSQFASLAPRQSPRRLFIIDPADRMNREAQNALLKTLEEPPGRSLLVLVASRPQLLLPTVRSRVFAVNFVALRAAELAALLEARGATPDEATARAALSGGRPGHALGLDLDDLLDRRAEIVEALESLSLSVEGASRIPEFAARLAGKTEDHLLQSLELLEALLRDAAVSATGSHRDRLAHPDLADPLAAIGDRLGAARLAAIIAALERFRNDLRFNLNRTLLAETLLAAVAGGPLP